MCPKVSIHPQARQVYSSQSAYFQKELLPAPRAFYQEELGQVGKRHNGADWVAGCRCPFHPTKSGKSASINIHTGGFYCHGCGAKGDIVSFMMRRYRLTFAEAAQRLGAWSNLSDTEQAQLTRLRAEQRRQRQAEARAKEQERRERIAKRDELHLLERLQKENSRRLAQLGPNFACAVGEMRIDNAELLIESIRDAEAEYRALAGLEPV